MKKNKISFETSFWPGYVAGNPFKAIKTFFDFADLDYYKQSLTEVLIYSYKREGYETNNPSNAFVFYTAINTFIKVCYCLQKKNKKWKVKTPLCSETTFHLSSLTEEEYNNPFIVFQKAFNENTLEEYESFLCQIMQLSLAPYDGYPYSDLTTPYIHLTKMLDAAALMRERGVEKIKKSKEVLEI